MNNKDFESAYKTLFPFWDKISDEDKSVVCQNTVSVSYEKGTTIHDGNESNGMDFVRSG